MAHREDLEFRKFDQSHVGVFAPVTTVTEAHYAINNGIGFMVGDIFEGIANDGEAVGLIQVGDNEIHAFLNVASQGDFYVRMYEAPTVTAVGTALTIFNKNRESVIVSGVTVTHTPTVSANGTELPPAFIHGGTGGNAQGGQGDNFSSEIVLARNKNYLFKLINKSGGAATMMGRLEWYEPDLLLP